MKTPIIRSGLLLVTIFIELLVIVATLAYLYKVKFQSSVLGSTTVAPLRKEYLIFPNDAPLKYYYEPKPNIVEEERPEWLDYTATYTINSDTLNERYDYVVEKPHDVYRIIALGDSFTFGHYVNTNDNWAEQLEDMLNVSQPCRDGRRYEVINLGERGYDAQYIAYRYKSRGRKYAPDFIIWLESGSGFNRIKEILDPLVAQATEELTSEEVLGVQSRPNTDPALNKAVHQMKQQYSEESLFEQVYAAWSDFFETRGNTPVLVTTFSYLPFRDMVKLKYWIGNRSNVWIYSGLPNIYESEGGLPDGHPNAKGHKLIAQHTLQRLSSLMTASCRK